MVDRICHNVTVEEERLAAIEAKLDALLAVVARLQPLIEKYAGPAMLDRWTRKRVK
jgi:N-methylhydantoinase B/oxoprolinase/acetone carboxylase alpha subunit